MIVQNMVRNNIFGHPYACIRRTICKHPFSKVKYLHLPYLCRAFFFDYFHHYLCATLQIRPQGDDHRTVRVTRVPFSLQAHNDVRVIVETLVQFLVTHSCFTANLIIAMRACI